MSLELQAAEIAAIDTLWKSWVSATDAELEATFKSLDYTSFLNVVKHLRNLGLIEEPQVPKLNIMVAGGLRFTLVGEGVIGAYCRDNTLKGKPFHVVLKEKKSAGAGVPSEVDLREYGVRIKIRRELPLVKDDPRILEALGKWATLPKSFRYMKRFSFTSLHHKGIQFDASFVRENKKDARGNYIQSTTFLGAQISKQPIHYEMEVEVLSGQNATQKSLLVGVASVLRGIQKSYVLVRNSIKQQVLALMAAQTGSPKNGFPGSQPVTLRKAHMGIEVESDTPNIRTTDYNVTDKADGLRCLLVVARNGRIYLVDRNLNVYGTDRRLDDAATAEWSGAVLDGEWVTQDAESKPMSRYYAFDIFNGKRGENVTERPFIVRAETAVSRLAAMTEATSVLNSASYVVAGIPPHNSLSIHMKTFQTPADTTDPNGIFKEAASILDRLKASAPYHTDGLIFTPNAARLPQNVNTWPQQLKWKPASMNSVDFLVSTEKERTSDGKPTTTELISTRLREDTNQFVRQKTLRLFVGSSTDPAFVDPRDTVLHKKPYPAGPDRAGGEYRAVEFQPQPPDPMASVCYVAINAGATDAAGAAPAAQTLDSLDDNIYCTESGDPIEDRTIVEMVYDPKKPAGWRWIPMRVRWDKTELYARGVRGGTMNAEKVANDVWTSIHDPITENMIRTGATTEELSVEGAAASSVAYYQRRASQRDLHKVRGLVDFHNRYIKDTLLLKKVLAPGAAVLDMSVGQAGDIHKWISARVGWVLGCDIALAGLTDNKNGAYRRYLDQIIKTRGSVPRMIFVQADSAARYMDGSAGQTQLDRTILRTLWGENEAGAPPLAMDLRGQAAAGFDVAAMMFSLHYFFKDKNTLDNLLRNISETVRVNGHFVGCCFDGDRVASLLRNQPLGGIERGNEDGIDIWSITKKYDDDSGILPPTEESLGRAIDVSFISIGESYTEYLVSWPYFVNRMTAIGMELLNAEEMEALGLQHSSNLFSESYTMATTSGLAFPMSPKVKTFSFLNRWFIFRRRSTGSLAAMPPQVPAQKVSALGAAAAAAAVANAAPEAVPEAEAEAVPEAEAEAEAVPEAEAEAEAEAVPEAEAEADAGAGKEASNLPVADGPVLQFYHQSAAKDDIKIRDKNWRRYISTFTFFPFKDTTNPAIVYPSLEAALGAAKYALASNKPELGAQIYSLTGNIHQKYEAQKADKTADEVAALIEEEGVAMRDAQKPAAFRKTGTKFNQEAWDSVKERVLADLVRQRYEGDVHFRDILNALAKLKVRLVYFTRGDSDLSGAEKGGIIQGENLLGRAYMKQVGFRV